MLDEYGYEIYEENEFPLAYLLTFRTYGTWLHGDDRGAMRRNGNNRFGGPKIVPSTPLKDSMRHELRSASFILDPQ